MYRSRSFPVVLALLINFLVSSPVNSGVVKRSIRMVREVYPPDIEPENEGNQAQQVCIVGDVVYGADETVPAEQPCLKCKCQPPGVQCETVQCAKKPGCKAIHRSNKCCPDYQCECEHDGKIYANGEKLETNPGGECKVCYCRGGEVQCAEVSCYIRKDCEGKRVPGKCCPKYDHCPPIDAVLDRTYLTTELPLLNTLKPVILELWQEPTANNTEAPSNPTLNSIREDSNKVPDTSDLVTLPPTFEEIPKKEESILPRITIQEIIPERKEIPITAPPKNLIFEHQGTLLIEEALPTSENTSNELNIDSEPESSEVSEVFHPPPVLRIGDKLLFLKKGDHTSERDTSTPASIITIIGAEGLQRGGVEESLEVHEVKIEPESDIQDVKNISDKKDNQTQDQSESTRNNDPIEESKIQIEEDRVQNDSDTNDLELKTAESTHILSLVKRKNKNAVQNISTTTTPEPISSKIEELTTIKGTIELPNHSESPKFPTEALVLPVDSLIQSLNDSKTIELKSETSTSFTPSSGPTTESQTKNTEPVAEQNPAYPPIPDIMPAVGDVSQKFEVEVENDNSTSVDMKILPEVFDFLSNKTKEAKNASFSEWLKNQDQLINTKMSLPEDLLKQRSPIDEDEEMITDSDLLSTSSYDLLNSTEFENISKEPTDKKITSSVKQTSIIEESSEIEKSPKIIESAEIGTDELLVETLHKKEQKHKEDSSWVEIAANKKEDSLIPTQEPQNFKSKYVNNMPKMEDSPYVNNNEQLPFSIPESEPELKKTEDQKSPNMIQQEKFLKHSKEEELLKGAQLIAEVKIDSFENDNIFPTIVSPVITTSKDPKVLSNSSTEEPKKIDTLSEKTRKELTNNTDDPNKLVEYIRTPSKSAESLEIDSGEQTTPKNNHSSMVSNENASVERTIDTYIKDDFLESNDMLSVSPKEAHIELGSVEVVDASTQAVPFDVEIITNLTSTNIKKEKTTETNSLKKDFEVINIMSIPKPTKANPVESSTYEFLPTPEETKSKLIIKREVVHDDVFKDLEKELDLDSASQQTHDATREENESDQIFKELVDETKGTVTSKPTSQDEKKIDEVSNALSGILFKGKVPDAGIFRLVGSLFGSKKK